MLKDTCMHLVVITINIIIISQLKYCVLINQRAGIQHVPESIATIIILMVQQDETID